MLNRKTLAAIIAAAAVIVIGGGVGVATAANLASTPEPTSSDTVAQTLTKASDAADPSETPTPAETPWPYTVVDNGEQTFLTNVKSPDVLFGIEVPSDDQLLADARTACDQLSQGVPFGSISAIEEDPDPAIDAFSGQPLHASNSRALAGLASESLCTEYSQLDVPVTPFTGPAAP